MSPVDILLLASVCVLAWLTFFDNDDNDLPPEML